MKHITKITRQILVFFSITLFICLMAGCFLPSDPGVWLRVDNHTDQELGIFIEDLHAIDVPLGEQTEFGTTTIWPNPNPPWGTEDYQYLIEAKTKKGDIVYSDNFTWQELDEMDWTIVIPPLQSN